MQTYIPDRIEQLISELQEKKADKTLVSSEIKHLKQLLNDNKEQNLREFKRLFEKLESLEEETDTDVEVFRNEISKDREEILKKVEKNSDSVTNIYKWFAGIMITLFLSYGTTAVFFIRSANDISHQVIVNSQKVEEIKQDVDNLEKKDQESFKENLPKASPKN